jgi:5-methylcytosine-specific restriction endonuclease McrA
VNTVERNAILRRDGYRCVLCRHPATEVHHVFRRRRLSSWLSEDARSLASLCQQCHVDCHAAKPVDLTLMRKSASLWAGRPMTKDDNPMDVMREIERGGQPV